MPALRAWILKIALLLLCVLLSACDRHNEFGQPAEFGVEPEAVCDWKTEWAAAGGGPDLVGDRYYVSAADLPDLFLDEQLTTALSFSPDQYDYGLAYTSYLKDTFNIVLTSRLRQSQFSEVLPSLLIEVNGEPLEIEDAEPATSIPLSVGENTMVMDIKARRVETLQTQSTECGYPSQRKIDEAIRRGEEPPIPTRTVDDHFQYRFTINRQSIDDMLMRRQSIVSSGMVDADAEDHFGSRVLLGRVITERTSGTSQEILIVSAPFEDSNAQGVFPVESQVIEAQDNSAPDSGAIYLYERSEEGAWVLSHYIKAANAGAGDRFGSVIALHDNMLVVSAPGEDSSSSGLSGFQNNDLAQDSGAVYVFEYNLDGWQQTAVIKPQNNQIGIDGFDDAFGAALSFKAGTLLVSSPKEDSSTGSGVGVGLPNSGTVYLYELDSSDGFPRTFAEPIAFKSANPGSGDAFGVSIDMAEDGLSFVVGAPGEDSRFNGLLNLYELAADSELRLFMQDNSVTDSGAAYVYSRESREDVWGDGVYVKADNRDEGDRFGSSVKMMADGSVLVGAPYEDSHGYGFDRNKDSNAKPDSGAVYLFSLTDGGVLLFSNYIKAPLPQEDEHFGLVLGSDGTDFVIAGPDGVWEQEQEQEQDFSVTRGKVYGYQFDQLRDFTQQLTFEFEIAEHDADLMNAQEYFGSSLSMLQGRLAVGAPGLTYPPDGMILDQAGGVSVYQ